MDRPVLFRPVIGSTTVTPVEQIWTRLTYNSRGDIAQIDYVAPEGGIVNGKNSFASIVIEPRAGGAGNRVVYKDAAGAVLREN